MLAFTKKNAYLALICVAGVALFGQDTKFTDSSKRMLSVNDDAYDGGNRRLQGVDTQVPYAEFAQPLQCGPGQVTTTLNWDGVDLSMSPNPNYLTISGMDVSMGHSATGSATVSRFEIHSSGGPFMGVKKKFEAHEIIESGADNSDLAFPTSYVTMEIEFLSESLKGLLISIGDIDSHSTTDIVRIRMFDDANADIPLDVAVQHPNNKLIEDYAWMNVIQTPSPNPGHDSSLYAKPSDVTIPVKKISLDLGLLAYSDRKIGKDATRLVHPALDFKYCADETASPSMSPTPVPTAAPTPATPTEPIDTPEPTPAPTNAPVAPTNAPVTPTEAPVAPAPRSDAGSNGDPIIMGMDGRIFKFIGRSGAWYSAISNSKFQWNMRLNQFEGCPEDSDTFTTGLGLTVFNSDGSVKHEIEVSVANPSDVYTGCGNFGEKEDDFGCLGAGSLELVVDGHKIVQATDMQIDETTSVTAFNTVSMCSRRWLDFDMTPDSEVNVRKSGGLKGSSATPLENLDAIGIFDEMSEKEQTMIDLEGCQDWMATRRLNNDLLQQTGTWSTVVIKTEDVSFHLEYKQEHERCSAHNIDVWMSGVNPEVMEEKWEGLIGESKQSSDVGLQKYRISREDALKYPTDEEYEVITAFSKQCTACVEREE